MIFSVLSRGESALQIRTEVPREFVIILQGIFIMTVVIVYQVAKRWAARRQLAREGMEDMEDSAASADVEGLAAEDAYVSGRLRRLDPDRLHVLHDHLHHRPGRGYSASDRAS